MCFFVDRLQNSVVCCFSSQLLALLAFFGANCDCSSGGINTRNKMRSRALVYWK